MMNDYNKPVKVDIIGGLEDRLMGCVGFILVVGIICVILQKIVLPILFVVLILVAALAIVAIPLFLWVCSMAYISSRRVNGPKSPLWFLSVNATAEHLKAFIQMDYRGNVVSIEVRRPFDWVNSRYMFAACAVVRDTARAKRKTRVFLCSWLCDWKEVELWELKVDSDLFYLFPQLRNAG